MSGSTRMARARFWTGDLLSFERFSDKSIEKRKIKRNFVFRFCAISWEFFLLYGVTVLFDMLLCNCRVSLYTPGYSLTSYFVRTLELFSIVIFDGKLWKCISAYADSVKHTMFSTNSTNIAKIFSGPSTFFTDRFVEITRWLVRPINQQRLRPSLNRHAGKNRRGYTRSCCEI